jgi:hypothetical protein
MRCEQELCENWTGDGDVCACAVFGIEKPKGCEVDGCGAPVEFRAVTVYQAGNEGRATLACGDGECVFQAVASLLVSARDVHGVLVQQWVA